MKYLHIIVPVVALVVAIHALLTKRQQGIPDAVAMVGFGLVALGGDVFPVIGALCILAWMVYLANKSRLSRRQ
jgi:hypothetical protein